VGHRGEIELGIVVGHTAGWHTVFQKASPVFRQLVGQSMDSLTDDSTRN
jgi:hypothetical protein